MTSTLFRSSIHVAFAKHETQCGMSLMPAGSHITASVQPEAKDPQENLGMPHQVAGAQGLPESIV